MSGSSSLSCWMTSGPPHRPFMPHVKEFRLRSGANLAAQKILDPKLAHAKAKAGIFNISVKPSALSIVPIISKNFGVARPKAKATRKAVDRVYNLTSHDKFNVSDGSFTNSPNRDRRTQAWDLPCKIN
jgi:hypothetical protein